MDALTVFDWGVIVIIGLSALLALFRGFIREVLSLATWIIAATVTIGYFEPVTEMLHPEHIGNKLIASGAATFGLFIGTLLVLTILSSVLIRFLQSGNELSMLDSLMGMAFGVLRGLFIVSLSYIMVTVVIPEDDPPEWLDQARTRPLVAASADFLSQLAPEYVSKMTEASKEAAQQGEDMRALQEQYDQLKGEEEGEGYKKTGRKELEALIEKLQKERGTTE